MSTENGIKWLSDRINWFRLLLEQNPNELVYELVKEEIDLDEIFPEEILSEDRFRDKLYRYYYDLSKITVDALERCKPSLRRQYEYAQHHWRPDLRQSGSLAKSSSSFAESSFTERKHQ